MRSIFRVGSGAVRINLPHPKSLRCATRFRPPHKGEVKLFIAPYGIPKKKYASAISASAPERLIAST